MRDLNKKRRKMWRDYNKRRMTRTYLTKKNDKSDSNQIKKLL